MQRSPRLEELAEQERTLQKSLNRDTPVDEEQAVRRAAERLESEIPPALSKTCRDRQR